MEDFAEKISQILGDEESMKQLGEIAQMLGFSPDGEALSTPPSPSAPQAPVPAVGAPDGGLGGMPDITTMIGLVSKLREAGGNDDNVNFLIALRPLLSEEKRPKIDRAIKILKLINLLPILRDSGILGGDLFGIL